MLIAQTRNSFLKATHFVLLAGLVLNFSAFAESSKSSLSSFSSTTPAKTSTTIPLSNLPVSSPTKTPNPDPAVCCKMPTGQHGLLKTSSCDAIFGARANTSACQHVCCTRQGAGRKYEQAGDCGVVNPSNGLAAGQTVAAALCQQDNKKICCQIHSTAGKDCQFTTDKKSCETANPVVVIGDHQYPPPGEVLADDTKCKGSDDFVCCSDWFYNDGTTASKIPATYDRFECCMRGGKVESSDMLCEAGDAKICCLGTDQKKSEQVRSGCLAAGGSEVALKQGETCQ